MQDAALPALSSLWQPLPGTDYPAPSHSLGLSLVASSAPHSPTLGLWDPTTGPLSLSCSLCSSVHSSSCDPVTVPPLPDCVLGP